MLEPKDLEGTPYVLSKFPALVGREIILQYPTSAMPKIGDYGTNEALMLKIMSYVAVKIDGRDEPMRLSSRALVDNHVKNAEDLMRLEWAMLSYNFAFFSNGSLSGIIDRVATQVVGLLQKTSTDLFRASQANKDGAGQV